MKIEVKNISKNIFLLVFENQKEITSTFLRFQEHFESPEFRGKIFTLKEYKEWYSKINGDFTYYSDWNGFNIPSYVLKPFYDGKFDPLSKKEEQVLELFKDRGGDFYIIGIHKNMEEMSNLLTHELAHGLFYTNKKYRESTIQIVSGFDLENIKTELRAKGGYHEDVLIDEIQAYLIDDRNKLNTKIPIGLKEKLKENYGKVIASGEIEIDDEILEDIRGLKLL